MKMDMSLLLFIEYLAVIVSSIYGVLLAARKGMDVMGVFAVAFAVAFGGGTLRDLFLDRTPLFWIGNPHYPMITLGIAVFSGPVLKLVNRIKPYLLLPDALGMALFAITGTAYSLEAYPSWFIAAMMGTITGTFGGVLGDMISNDVTSLFTPSPLNATCAFAGCWVYLIVLSFGETPKEIAMILAILVIVLFRLAAVKWNWCFPAVRETPHP